MFINLRPVALAVSLSILGAAGVAVADAHSATEKASSNCDVAQKEKNRKLVVDFYNGVFNQHDVVRASDVVSDGYIQHNPHVPNGKAPFVNYFTQFFKDNPDARSRIVRSAVDGDMVYLHVHSTDSAGDRGRAIVDIFRVEDDKIVEHWDVIQDVPEKAANTNTMF